MMRMEKWHFTLELPARYRVDEVLGFHWRDPEGLAEQVSPTQIRKGFLLDGTPLVMDIRLQPGTATCQVEADAPLPAHAPETMEHVARNLLGLHLDPGVFESFTRRDTALRALVRRQSGLRIPQTSTPFEAITWAIIGQQIHLSFAVTLRRTLIQLAGRPHSSGLWCYPDAAAVARLDADTLGRRKFSRAKAETLIRVARLVESMELPLPHGLSAATPAAQIEAALLAIKGIGPWTVNYALLRGFGYGDCSLHGDAGVRIAWERLTSASGKATSEEIRQWLAPYAPHRSMVAAHLWASLKDA